MLGSKEHYEVMSQFEKYFKHMRLDREQDKSLWKKGNVYQDGRVNELFGGFLSGYQLGRGVERMEAE